MGVMSDIKILNAHVMHHRLKPKQNKFLYSVYYLSLPLKFLDIRGGNWLLGFNRAGLFSFYAKDHGESEVGLKDWVLGLLAEASIENVDVNAIRLITMPRVLGYAFNPVSFWVVPDSTGNTVAVICEVNNTFGERHIYICSQAEGRAILPSDVLVADKIFHVSPFLQREGEYKFRFSYKENFFAAFIDYMDDQAEPMLLTSVSGKMREANTESLLGSFFRYPFMTLKVITLIHLQAVIILLKGIKYVPKPLQNSQKNSLIKSSS